MCSLYEQETYLFSSCTVVILGQNNRRVCLKVCWSTSRTRDLDSSPAVSKIGHQNQLCPINISSLWNSGNCHAFVIFDRDKEEELEQEKSRRKELEQRYKVNNDVNLKMEEISIHNDNLWVSLQDTLLPLIDREPFTVMRHFRNLLLWNCAW